MDESQSASSEGLRSVIACLAALHCQLLAVQIAEDDLADEGMRFEEGNKALGERARADDADA